MKKILLFTTLFVFAIASALAQTTYYVSTTGDDGTGNGSIGNPWKTIQKAIDANETVDGDTILVCAGTYNLIEPVNITKKLTLTGNVSQPENVIINAPTTSTHVTTGNRSGFLVSASNVTIEGFHITGALDRFESPYNTQGTYQQNWAIFVGYKFNGASAGIYYNDIDNIIIRNNIISNSSAGIHLYNNNNVTIQENTIYDISLGFGDPVYSGGNGITLYNTTADATIGNYKVIGNTIYNCDFAGIAVNVDGTGDWVDLTGSEITNNKIYDNVSDLGASWGGIYAGLKGGFGIRGWNQIQGLKIQGNTIYGHRSSDNSYPYIGGIRIQGTKDLLVDGNNIYDNERGIYLGAGTTDAPVVTSNKIHGNDYGIYLNTGTITDVDINLNDLSGNAMAIVNNFSGIINATCNWYGTPHEAEIKAKIQGDVKYFPYKTDDGPDSCLEPSFEVKIKKSNP